MYGSFLLHKYTTDDVVLFFYGLHINSEILTLKK